MALASAPTAALAANAYPAPQDALTVNAQRVVPGGEVMVSVGGPAGSEAQVQVTSSGEDATIAGTVTSAVKVIQSDATPVMFTVTVPSASGTVGVTALLDGVAVDTATISVVSEAAAAASDDLSVTGPEVVGIAVAAIVLVGGGAAIAIAARRRRDDD
ncbi:hypothetical protein [Demequina sp. NBRC 110055]|uniref:hypothetical protein n=1 Tax=Demequina sp. NBRC 110055 TaxID=1570344 RepID=UPI0011852597|nr:hypothetical protein [Demequina sp. NBRC 110055]